MNLWLIPIFPLIGFLINGLFRESGFRSRSLILSPSVRWRRRLAWVVWVISSALSLWMAAHHEHYFTWFQSGVFNVAVDFFLDRLNAVMLLIKTGIGLLIHIYAIGYMSHEGGYYRFFSYLKLFMFFMLVLVLAQNFLVMFVGWEGVGLCSYLLIGFYYHEQYATDVYNKAFIFNRVGDFLVSRWACCCWSPPSERSISSSSQARRLISQLRIKLGS